MLRRRQDWFGKLLRFALVAAGFAGGVPTYSQLLHASGPLPSFEVVCIRQSSTGQGPATFGPARIVRPDRFEMKDATVNQMIEYAYGIVFDHELTGGPA